MLAVGRSRRSRCARWILSCLVFSLPCEAGPLFAEIKDCSSARVVYDYLAANLQRAVDQSISEECHETAEPSARQEKKRETCAELSGWIELLKSSRRKLTAFYETLDCRNPIDTLLDLEKKFGSKDFNCVDECHPANPRNESSPATATNSCWQCDYETSPRHKVACSTRRDAMALLGKSCREDDKTLCGEDRMVCRDLKGPAYQVIRANDVGTRCIVKDGDALDTSTVGFTASVPVKVPGIGASGGYQHQFTTSYKETLTLRCSSPFEGVKLDCTFPEKGKCLIAPGSTCTCGLSLAYSGTDLDTAHFDVSGNGKTWSGIASKLFIEERISRFTVSTCSDEVPMDRCQKWKEAVEADLRKDFADKLGELKPLLTDKELGGGKEGDDCTVMSPVPFVPSDPDQSKCGYGLTCRELSGIFHADLNHFLTDRSFSCQKGYGDPQVCKDVNSAGGAARCCMNALGDKACHSYGGVMGGSSDAQKCCKASGSKHDGSVAPFIGAEGGMCLQTVDALCKPAEARSSVGSGGSHGGGK